MVGRSSLDNGLPAVGYAPNERWMVGLQLDGVRFDRFVGMGVTTSFSPFVRYYVGSPEAKHRYFLTGGVDVHISTRANVLRQGIFGGWLGVGLDRMVRPDWRLNTTLQLGVNPAAFRTQPYRFAPFVHLGFVPQAHLAGFHLRDLPRDSLLAQGRMMYGGLGYAILARLGSSPSQGSRYSIDLRQNLGFMVGGGWMVGGELSAFLWQAEADWLPEGRAFSYGAAVFARRYLTYGITRLFAEANLGMRHQLAGFGGTSSFGAFYGGHLGSTTFLSRNTAFEWRIGHLEPFGASPRMGLSLDLGLKFFLH